MKFKYPTCPKTDMQGGDQKHTLNCTQKTKRGEGDSLE